MIFKNSSIFAISYSFVGLFIGLNIMKEMNESYHLFVFILPIAFLITSIILWKYIVDKPRFLIKNEPYHSRVIFAGFAIGVVSHPVSFLFMVIISNVAYWLKLNNHYFSLNEPNDLLEFLIVPFIGSFFSLLIYGWITIPSAIVISILVLLLNRSKLKRS